MSSNRWQDWSNVVLGAWLSVAPFLLGQFGAAAWNAWFVGAAIVIVGLWALSLRQSHAAEWSNVVLGAWMVVAPSALNFSGALGSAWNAWIVGTLVALLSLWAISDQSTRPQKTSHP